MHAKSKTTAINVEIPGILHPGGGDSNPRSSVPNAKAPTTDTDRQFLKRSLGVN
jgi:hypothetical protein